VVKTCNLIASVDERRSDVGLLEYKAVLHHLDIVEEIATQRHGEIDAIDKYISDSKKQPPHRWRVCFLDGRDTGVRCPDSLHCNKREARQCAYFATAQLYGKRITSQPPSMPDQTPA
jgi:hypothetical protein